MEWQHQWGPRIATLEKIEEESGKTPEALLNRPKLVGLASEVAFAYNVLASKRTVGFSANPIQLSEILAFFQLYGMPFISVDTFIELLGTMDTKYLELSNGNKPASKRPNKPSGRRV